MWARFSLPLLLPFSSSSLLLLLLPLGMVAMTCNSDGVLCVAEPQACTSSCDYLLKYRAASADTTQVEVSGKPASHSLSATNVWLAFGFSTSGSMRGLTVYACQKYNNVYTVRKRTASGHGLSSETEDVASGTIEGSDVEGSMTCKYTIQNSKLPSTNLKMAYGMGQLFGDDGMSKHSQTPRRTSDSFSLIQQFSGSLSCSKPTIQDGTVSPNSATIDSGSQYTVACGSGFTISGSVTVTCTNGQLSALTNCVAGSCSKPTIQDGSVSPDSPTIVSGAQYMVSCISGFTISGSTTVTCTNGQLSALPTCNKDAVTTCSKPTIQDGTVSPDSATIDSGSQYTVTCGSGFTISGSVTVICTNGQLSALPTCNSAAPCSKPTIDSGSVSPDTATITSGSQFSVTCTTGSTISGSATVTCTDGALSLLPTCSKDEGGTNADSTCELSTGCHRNPTGCTSTSCSYSLRWSTLGQGDSETVKVKLTGKPADYEISDTGKMWIAFGFSEYGLMANADIYLCLKIDEVYSTNKVDGFSHGITANKEIVDLDGGTVVGSFNDGVFSCSYDIKSSHLPTKLQPMLYGMGPVDDQGNVIQHHKDPRTTTQKFSLLSEEISSSSTIIASTLLMGAVGLRILLI